MNWNLLRFLPTGSGAEGDSVAVGTDNPLPVTSVGAQTDALTDAELRAADVAVTLDGESVAVTGTQTDALTDAELRAADVGVVLGQESDSNNTQAVTSSEASPGSPWIGAWTQTRADGIVRVLTVLAGSTSAIPGTFTFEFTESSDPDTDHPTLGTAEISEARPISTFSTVRDFDLLNAGAYYRCAFEPDSALGAETVFITTTLRKQNDGAFVRLAEQEIERQNAAMPQTFAYLKGFNSAGLSRDLTIDERAALRVNPGSTIATFGDLISSSRQDQITVNFSETTPEILVDTDTTGTGTVTNASAQSVVASGTTASSTAQMQTRRTVNYEPSHELYAYFTATFSTPTANGEQFIGLFDDDNGFAVGYLGTTFCVRRRDGGTDTDVALADFNGSLATEFTRDGVAEALDPALGNVYRIRFGWLGNAPILFEVLAPDGNWVVMHAIKYPNSSTVAHIADPDLPLRSYVDNGSDAVNVSIATSSWAAGIVKVESGTKVIFQRTSARDGTLPSGGAPTIDPVFNSDSNVYDSGWIRAIDFPGGNFLNIVGDQALNVYLMNASDDQGSNIVGDTQPSIQTVASIPATFQAPYFDDFYRILISNESGSTATSYSFYNRGHASAQQGLVIGVEQTLLGFFATALGRNILAAKNDAGNYGNIGRADLGGLRTAVNEYEIQVPISPLTAFETNGSASIGTTPVQIATGLSAETKTISIKSNPNASKVVYIGNSAAVGVVSGWPLAAGDSVDLEVNESVTIYARSASGTETVHWMGVNTHEDAP